MRTTAAFAAAGMVVGGVVAMIVHLLSWTAPAPDFGWTAFAPLREPRAPYSSTLVVHFDGVGGHPSWAPLVPIGLGVGLLAGSLLGVAVVLAGVRLRRI